MVETTSNIAIAAMGKHGKTWLNVYMLQNMKAKKQEIWIYDPLREKVYTRLAKKNPKVRLIRPRIATVQDFNRLAMEAFNHGSVRLVGEECHYYLPPRLQLKKYLGIMELIMSGRHRGVGLTVISRRFGAMSTDVVSLADHVFIGRCFSPADLRYAKDYVGDWKRLMTCPKREFAHFSDRGLIWRKVPRVKL
jgi:DNA helicase HerA-like ATPase